MRGHGINKFGMIINKSYRISILIYYFYYRIINMQYNKTIFLVLIVVIVVSLIIYMNKSNPIQKKEKFIKDPKRRLFEDTQVFNEVVDISNTIKCTSDIDITGNLTVSGNLTLTNSLVGNGILAYQTAGVNYFALGTTPSSLIQISKRNANPTITLDMANANMTTVGNFNSNSTLTLNTAAGLVGPARMVKNGGNTYLQPASGCNQTRFAPYGSSAVKFLVNFDTSFVQSLVRHDFLSTALFNNGITVYTNNSYVRPISFREFQLTNTLGDGSKYVDSGIKFSQYVVQIVDIQMRFDVNEIGTGVRDMVWTYINDYRANWMIMAKGATGDTSNDPSDIKVTVMIMDRRIADAANSESSFFT